ncbi:NAD(P)-dependent oxidoreductase [Maribacter sp. ACAM166]|uniref:NAD(P)-dependent oxidoreductase n=1 Tax=Maribacter sp. ACAM166 TaxID=2508996 RepID=UPI0010FE4370|nr:NAD(P)-dependent oxidoreductase [Maribacter sp. ACAM166]TLP81328.1 dihydrofolate reductase [Maribacter sp. ACAM166]
MFKKLVGIEPLELISSANKKLESFTETLILHQDQPSGVAEIVKRIGDADGVLLSHRSSLGREVLEQCPTIKYIGMCCSLYAPESANVDILYANSKGITVKGVRDYGDEGVVEYVISELVRCLHGIGKRSDGTPRQSWSGIPREITGLKAGIVGLGKSGGMVADALRFFGAEISYFARSEKEDAKAKGYRFLPLKQLLSENEVVITCLNKNTVLLHDAEFKHLGNRKILFNTGLSPSWDTEPFEKWLNGDNVLYCDTLGALGDERFLKNPNVTCLQVSTGRTQQAFRRLSEKVLANLTAYTKML